VIFRSEIAVLVATQTLFLLMTQQASLTETIIPAGATGLTLGLLLSVSIDSFFWQQFPLWPELTGFYYNTILGKSSDWGVSPWHFYFTSSLPRLLLNPLTCGLILLAVSTPATRTRALTILIPTLSFVVLYSLLPHKEWRFIVYVVPPLTAVSSLGASWVWTRRTKSIVYATLTFALLVSVLASLAASSTLLAISSLNYPGGEAVMRLREVAANETGTVYVYADNLVCQTGLTRFLEGRYERVDVGGVLAPRWVFDKTEDQTTLLEPGFWRRFDYVLVEHPSLAIGAWEVVEVVEGFAGIRIVRPGDDENNGKAGIFGQIEQIGRKLVTKGWWARVKMEPKVTILKKDRPNMERSVTSVSKLLTLTERF
jgi:alpha-1,6-mannosyltransferase